MRPLLLALTLASTLTTSAWASPPRYQVVKRIPVSGEGFWDYLTFDQTGNRLFVSHQDRVVVVSPETGKELGTIAGLEGVHGIALAPELGRGFISDGKANVVTVFDLKTLERVKDVKVTGQNPDAILYEPVHHQVLTFNGRSNNATVIDAKTLSPVATIPLPGKPEFAVADSHGRVFVNIEDTAQLVELELANPRVVATWRLKPCESPTGLALDEKHQRLFSVCENSMMVVTDAQTGKQIASVPIGAGPDGVAFDPGTQLAFSSNGQDGTLTIVHEKNPAHFEVIQTLPTQKSARTLTLDPRSGTVFLSVAKVGERPAATVQNPHPRPSLEKGSFTVLVAAPVKEAASGSR